MSARSIILLVLAAVLILVASTGLFTVRETQQVIVMQFGDPRRVVKEPGLHWKIPFLQQANYFDSRILNLDIPAQEVIASDQKRLEVDAFARFRITDPLLTYQTVRNELGAKSRIQTIMASNLRQVLASEPLRTIVSGERSRLMTTIRDSVNANAKRFGIDVVDMRLRRVDLPEANSKTIFERMRTEREREAEEARAEGRELAARIRAQADRERTVLLAEASRDAQKLRGEGDGSAVKIFADAFGKDVDFFEFYRTMEAYRKSLKGNSTTVILSPDSEYLGYLRGSEKKN
ncbi:protein HflC [Iodidimonas gelatinilytica]|uniref:Protein HflC n=1 Tax=Iodidimonas gelatinilytica TaxID=1236966 RepID=A0A5A7MRC2_9PROT|nr:protease modulator HflC [Iodidimonas gelatinilytica]GEQ97773.1 protein HflC [Iodidimonas gelatinilytica]GER01278.1 protein HflC [Iodidimonas gelatinilytica]